MKFFSKIFILGFLFLMTFNSAYAQGLCSESFHRSQKINSRNVGFSQNFLGFQWAVLKLEKITADFLKWTENGESSKKRDFVLWSSRESPLPAYVDVRGQVRLNDNHHKFFSYTRFLDSHNFDVYVTIKKDYRSTNPQTGRPWKKSEMMADLIANNYVFIYGNPTPRFRDLRRLPSRISEMMDLPERSVISMVFASFDTPMKGSDFIPMIQVLLSRELTQREITVVYDTSYSLQSINQVKRDVLRNVEIVNFLLKSLNPELSTARRQRLETYFNQHLESLRASE